MSFSVDQPLDARLSGADISCPFIYGHLVRGRIAFFTSKLGIYADTFANETAPALSRLTKSAGLLRNRDRSLHVIRPLGPQLVHPNDFGYSGRGQETFPYLRNHPSTRTLNLWSNEIAPGDRQHYGRNEDTGIMHQYLVKDRPGARTLCLLGVSLIGNPLSFLLCSTNLTNKATSGIVRNSLSKAMHPSLACQGSNIGTRDCQASMDNGMSSQILPVLQSPIYPTGISTPTYTKQHGPTHDKATVSRNLAIIGLVGGSMFTGHRTVEYIANVIARMSRDTGYHMDLPPSSVSNLFTKAEALLFTGALTQSFRAVVPQSTGTPYILSSSYVLGGKRWKGPKNVGSRIVSRCCPPSPPETEDYPTGETQ